MGGTAPGRGWDSVSPFASSALLSRPTTKLVENSAALGYSTEPAPHLRRRGIPRGAPFEPAAPRHLPTMEPRTCGRPRQCLMELARFLLFLKISPPRDFTQIQASVSVQSFNLFQPGLTFPACPGLVLHRRVPRTPTRSPGSSRSVFPLGTGLFLRAGLRASAAPRPATAQPQEDGTTAPATWGGAEGTPEVAVVRVGLRGTQRPQPPPARRPEPRPVGVGVAVAGTQLRLSAVGAEWRRVARLHQLP